MKNIQWAGAGLVLVSGAAVAEVGVGAKPPEGADVLFDGSRKMLNEKWTY